MPLTITQTLPLKSSLLILCCFFTLAISGTGHGANIIAFGDSTATLIVVLTLFVVMVRHGRVRNTSLAPSSVDKGTRTIYLAQ